MGYAVWFYGTDAIPVLQCVYPDLENRFPWDTNAPASWRKRQPLLFANRLPATVEDDFWAANDPTSSLHRWRASLPPHTGVYTTKRIVQGEEPVTHVFHDSNDGAWQFHGPTESKDEDCILACLHHVVDRDPSVESLFDLPPGWNAHRDGPAAAWVRELTQDSEAG
jgi:hypothetical protein